MTDHADDIARIQRIDIVPTILDTLCQATGMGFAAIARVTDEQWIACSVHDAIAFGLEPGGELDLTTTICHEIRQHGEPVVIPDVAEDPHYCGHHTPERYGFRSYISVPIVLPDGAFFGTLCAIDPAPRPIARAETLRMFTMFAQIVGVQLDQDDRLARAEGRLSVQGRDAELREQFIAVLGHDLRNPLANIDSGIRILRRNNSPERLELVLDNMQASVSRMMRMIDSMLDFARGRLGGGITLDRRQVELAPLLEQVVSEVRHAHPERALTLSCESGLVGLLDASRAEQMLSNLIGNAITHGDADHPVEVEARTGEGEIIVAISNAGRPIPEKRIARLFRPFERGPSAGRGEGLGLGLFIAAEIARAHGGRLAVESDADRTCFAFHLPLAAAPSG